MSRSAAHASWSANDDDQLSLGPREKRSYPILMEIGETITIELRADRPVDLYIVDEGHWKDLQSGRPFKFFGLRSTRDVRHRFKAPRASTWHIVAYNPHEDQVNGLLRIYI